MATAAEKKQAYEQWKEHCKRVQSITDTALLAGETPAQKDRRILRLQGNYAAFCEYYFPHFLTLRDKTTGEVIRTIHNAPFHNAAAAKVKGTPNLKAVFMWPRGHAKSTHMDIFVPLWLMFQPKRLINFMVVVGKSEDSATRLLGDIQAELEHNQRIIADFGKQQGNASWQDGEFKAANGVKFLACGRGQSPRGLRDREARPDYIVIDDLDDDELCRNEKRVHDITDWVKEALFGALDVGRGRFIMVGNLISKNSVLANLTKTKRGTCIRHQGNRQERRTGMARKMDERRGAGIQGFRRLPGMGKGDDAQPHRGRNYFSGRLDSLQETAQAIQV